MPKKITANALFRLLDKHLFSLGNDKPSTHSKTQDGELTLHTSEGEIYIDIQAGITQEKNLIYIIDVFGNTHVLKTKQSH